MADVKKKKESKASLKGWGSKAPPLPSPLLFGRYTSFASGWVRDVMPCSSDLREKKRGVPLPKV
jgi:hypothetical protein